MKSKKLTLSNLKISSFVTNLNYTTSKTYKGGTGGGDTGSQATLAANNCPTNTNTQDVIVCETGSTLTTSSGNIIQCNNGLSLGACATNRC